MGVGKSATEHNHLYVVQSLATRYKVGHHHILHVESGQIEAVRHLALAVGTLLAYDGSLRTQGSSLVAAVGTDAVMGKSTDEIGRKAVCYGLVLIVTEAFVCHSIHALMLVEFMRSGVPHIAQGIDIERKA